MGCRILHQICEIVHGTVPDHLRKSRTLGDERLMHLRNPRIVHLDHRVQVRVLPEYAPDEIEHDLVHRAHEPSRQGDLEVETSERGSDA